MSRHLEQSVEQFLNERQAGDGASGRGTGDGGNGTAQGN
jgi:hypothetical protein